jgi:hypothetical protein
LIIPLILAFHLAIGLAALSFTNALERMVIRLYSENFHGKLTVESVRVDFLSGILVESIMLQPALGEIPVLTARSVRISLSAASLLEGTPEIHAIHVKDPVVTLEEDEEGVFTFEKLPRAGRLEALMDSTDRAEDGEPLRIFITNGLCRFVGQGPLAEEVNNLIEPDQEVSLRVPYFHWIDGTDRAMTQKFSIVFHHDALGEIRSDGEMDVKGVKKFLFDFDGVPVRGKRFRTFFTEQLQDYMNTAGFDGRLSMRIEAERDREGKLQNQIFFKGFSIYHELFPLQIDEVEGRAHYAFKEKRLLFERVTGVGLGQRVLGNGVVDFADEIACRFTVSGKDIPFCPDLEKALEAVDGGRDYRAYAPRGKADFSYTGGISVSDPVVRGVLRIWPQGEASASYEGYLDPITGIEESFPYRIHNLRGEIQIHRDKVRIIGLEGYRAPEKVREGNRRTGAAQGRFFMEAYAEFSEGKFPLEMYLYGQDFRVDQTILEGLALYDAPTAKTIEELRPEGRFDMAVRVVQNDEVGTRINTVLDLKDITVRFEEFDAPITDIRGRVWREPDGTILFQDLNAVIGSDSVQAESAAPLKEGTSEPDILTGRDSLAERTGSGTLFINGRMKDGEVRELKLSGRNQPVTPEVKDGLRRGLPEGTNLDWLDLDYEGTVNFDLSMVQGELSRQVDLDLELNLDRVTGPYLPTVLEDVRGNMAMDITHDLITADNLTLRAGGGRFSFSRLDLDYRGDWMLLDLEGVGQGVAVNADLSHLLEGPMLERWQAMGCTGGIDLNRIVLTGEFDKYRNVRQFSTELDLRINSGAMDNPFAMDNIHGNLYLDIAKKPGRESSLILKARTKDFIFAVKDRLFTDVESFFTIDEKKLEVLRFEGIFYGGNIKGVGETPLWVEFDAPRKFAGDFELEGAELKNFLSRTHYALRNIQGKVDGRIEFEGDIENQHRATAAGNFTVRQGALFEIPVFSDLSSLVGNVLSSDKPTFSGCEAVFDYEGGVIDMPELSLQSNILELRGEGRATFDGLDVSFIPSTSFVPTIPIIGHFFDWLKDGLLTFKVTGPWSNLDVSYDFIVERMFTEDDIPLEFRTMGRIDYDFEDYF